MPEPGRRALVLVRNAVTHDARVLREAATLRGLGFEVLVVGVVSAVERDRALAVGGFDVIRLARPFAKHTSAPTSERQSRSTTPPRGGLTARLTGRIPPRVRRLALTAAYHLQGIALVRRARPELVHANDYNTMWIALAAKFLGSRVVYDCHELWPDRNGRPEWRPWLLACEWLFVRLADTVITASPGYATEIARRYRVPTPTVIRNIPERPIGFVASRDPDLGLVVYVGGLMPGRGIESAIRAMALLPSMRLRLLGPARAEYRQHLWELAASLGVTDRIEFTPTVSPHDVIPAVAAAGVGLMLIEPVCRSYELTLPNKLFEYAIAEVPVLASDLEVIGPVVKTGGLGAVTAPRRPEEIAAALRHLADPATNAAARERVRRFASQNSWPRERLALEQVYCGDVEAHGASSLREVYGKYASNRRKRRSWSAENPGNAAIRRELVAAVQDAAGEAILPARRLLDIGCGSGWWLEALAANRQVGASLTGVDVLEERVKAARQRVPSARIEVHDARSLPLNNGAFDIVTIFTVLSSLRTRDEVRAVLREASRVTRPGGMIVVWEPRMPNPFNPHTRLIRLRDLMTDLPGASVHERSTTVLPALARRLGRGTEQLYPQLTRLSWLRTHRLVTLKTPGQAGSCDETGPAA